MKERWLWRTQNTGELRSTRPKSLCHHDGHMSLALARRRQRQKDHRETGASLGSMVQIHTLGSRKSSVCRFASWRKYAPLRGISNREFAARNAVMEHDVPPLQLLTAPQMWSVKIFEPIIPSHSLFQRSPLARGARASVFDIAKGSCLTAKSAFQLDSPLPAVSHLMLGLSFPIFEWLWIQQCV